MTMQLLSFIVLGQESFRCLLIALVLTPLRNRYSSTKCLEGGDRQERWFSLLKKMTLEAAGHRGKNTLFT